MGNLLELCSSMFGAKQYDKVIRCCDNYLKMKPKSGAAWYLKGLAFIQQNKSDKAEECFKNAAELDPKESANYEALGTLFYNERLFEEAIPLFYLGYSIKPSVNSLFMVALSNMLLKREGEAKTAIRMAIKLNKKETISYIKHFFVKQYKKSKNISDKEKLDFEKNIMELARE